MQNQVHRSNAKALMAAGVVLALVGLAAVIFIVQSNSAPPRNVKVLVAAQNLDTGVVFTQPSVQVVLYAKDQVPDTALSSFNDVNGQYTASAVTKGTPITKSMVVPTLAAPITPVTQYLKIPTGQVAIAIPSGGDLQNVAGFIQSGDHIDIIATGLPGQKPGTVTFAFTDLKIELTAGSTAGASSQSGARSPSGASWVVYLDPQKAEELIYLFNNGQYKFALRSRVDFTKPEGDVPPVGTQEFNSAHHIQ